MELRKDPITGRQVAFAPERASRPFEHEHAESPSAMSLDRCPFCRGNEDLTPEAVLQPGKSGEASPDWLVRVIPNRYPAFAMSDGKCADPNETDSSEIAFEAAPGSGRHEVLIESPDHHCAMAELSSQQFRRVIEVYHQRIRALREDDRLAHATIFKNQGAAAGASLEHVHSQLVATPFVPRTFDDELAAAVRFAGAAHTDSPSLWSAILKRELLEASRVVSETDSFVAFCPFASRFPYETWIVPRQHEPHFAETAESETHEFAEFLRTTLTALERVLPIPAYNFALCTAPFRDPRSAAYHWHLKITPRIAGIAGFEVGTGGWINIVLPEVAAANLREVW